MSDLSKGQRVQVREPQGDSYVGTVNKVWTDRHPFQGDVVRVDVIARTGVRRTFRVESPRVQYVTAL